MASMVSKNSSSSNEDGGVGGATAARPAVTSCLYLHRPEGGAGALDKDAVLRRIRQRRRANRLRESLRSLLLVQQQQQQQAAPAPETNPGERLAALDDDAFSSP